MRCSAPACLPLPTLGTRFQRRVAHPLTVSYAFPITGGNPDLAGPSGDIYHSGGINFVSSKARLEIGRFDIDLAAGKIFTRAVNFAPGRIPVLDLDLSPPLGPHRRGAHRAVRHHAAAGPGCGPGPERTFGLALPTDGSLVFGHARVAINN